MKIVIIVFSHLSTETKNLLDYVIFLAFTAASYKSGCGFATVLFYSGWYYTNENG
jgi:hypothetical protein